MPNTKVKSVKIEITATVGMVKPMLANADPSAKFRLVCKLSSRAALTAEKPSGINTTAAIIIPTTACGAPHSRTMLSMVGDNDLPSNTTAASAITKNTKDRRKP